MKDSVTRFPSQYQNILDDTHKQGFDQSSEPLLGSLLATLAASKAGGCILELGTGSGLSTVWLLHGMNTQSTLTSIDIDKEVVSIAKRHLGDDPRVNFLIGDAEQLITSTQSNSVDFIFADAWPGKYSHVTETLSLLKEGGIYLVDDMRPRASWSQGHAQKADKLIDYLESRDDLVVSKLAWSSGIIIVSKTCVT